MMNVLMSVGFVMVLIFGVDFLFMSKYSFYSYIAEFSVDGCLFTHPFYSPHTALNFWQCHNNLKLSIVVYRDKYYLDSYSDIDIFKSNFVSVYEKYEK